MALTDISVTFNDVLKSPLTYALIVLSIIATIFVNSFINSTDQRDINCQKENSELRIQLTTKDEKYDNLVKAFLVKQGVIDNLQKIVKKDTLNKDNNE